MNHWLRYGVLEQFFAEFYFHSCGYSVFGVAERADHCAARRLLSLFNRRFQFFEITRDREHVPVVAFRKEIIAQVDVIIISVLQFVVTADIGTSVRFLVEERSHFDK